MAVFTVWAWLGEIDNSCFKSVASQMPTKVLRSRADSTSNKYLYAGPADWNYCWRGVQRMPKIFVFLIIFVRGVAYFN